MNEDAILIVSKAVGAATLSYLQWLFIFGWENHVVFSTYFCGNFYKKNTHQSVSILSKNANLDINVLRILSYCNRNKVT